MTIAEGIALTIGGLSFVLSLTGLRVKRTVSSVGIRK